MQFDILVRTECYSIVLHTLRRTCAAVQAIERQAAAGVAEADSLVLVVDGQTGLAGADEEIVAWLRKVHPNKPVSARPLLSPCLAGPSSVIQSLWQSQMLPTLIRSTLSGACDAVYAPKCTRPIS